MPTAVINQSQTRVHLCGERLEIHGKNEATGREETLREIPLRDVERLVVSETAHFTPAALAEVLRRGIPIQYFSWQGRFLGQFLPAENRHGLSRLQQYQRSLDLPFCLDMATRLIAAKLYNQRRVLQRLRSSHKTPLAAEEAAPGAIPAPPQADSEATRSDAVARSLSWLDAQFASLRQAESLEELRGYEGAAAARYFQAWALYLPAEFPFERRSSRPPLNPVNACISFGATLLANEMTAFLHAHGMDPALGFLHATENGRWSLALDLMEPFRPALVEALALDLFSHKILQEKHFEPKNGGILLNEAGRKRFFVQYERRMERQFLSECAGHRTTLRQQLEQQAILCKAALETPARFEPFLMN